jgi:hypothetical protein
VESIENKKIQEKRCLADLRTGKKASEKSRFRKFDAFDRAGI